MFSTFSIKENDVSHISKLGRKKGDVKGEKKWNDILIQWDSNFKKPTYLEKTSKDEHGQYFEVINLPKGMVPHFQFPSQYYKMRALQLKNQAAMGVWKALQHLVFFRFHVWLGRVEKSTYEMMFNKNPGFVKFRTVHRQFLSKNEPCISIIHHFNQKLKNDFIPWKKEYVWKYVEFDSQKNQFIQKQKLYVMLLDECNFYYVPRTMELHLNKNEK